MSYNLDFSKVKFFGKEPIKLFKKDIEAMKLDYKDDKNFNNLENTLKKEADEIIKIINGIIGKCKSTSKNKNVAEKALRSAQLKANVVFQQTNLPKTKSNLSICYNNCSSAIDKFIKTQGFANVYHPLNGIYLNRAENLFNESKRWVDENRLFSIWEGTYYENVILKGEFAGGQPVSFTKP